MPLPKIKDTQVVELIGRNRLGSESLASDGSSLAGRVPQRAGTESIVMANQEEWKIEVVDADIDERFDSKEKAEARFDKLVQERYDHEIVTLYQIGSNGAEITSRTERGLRRLTQGICADCAAPRPSREHLDTLVQYGSPVREKAPVGDRGHWLEITYSYKCPKCGALWENLVESGAGGHGNFWNRIDPPR